MTGSPEAPENPLLPGVEIRVTYTARTAGVLLFGALFTTGTSLVIVKARQQVALHQDDGMAPVIHPLLYVLPLLGLAFVAIALAFRAEKNRTPLRLDPQGVTMRDGTVHPWSEFQGAARRAYRLKTGGYLEFGLTLKFARRTAVIMYRPLTNAAELGPYLSALRENRSPFG